MKDVRRERKKGGREERGEGGGRGGREGGRERGEEGGGRGGREGRGGEGM